MSSSTSPRKRFTRKRLYINPDIQGKLVVKTIVHWLLYMVAVLITVTIWKACSNHEASISTLAQEVCSVFAPALLAGVVLLPLFLYDQLKFSNRMAGPIYRMRQEMKKLIKGEGVQKLRFRDRDHWPEFAEDFNRLAELVIRNRRSLRNYEEKRSEIVRQTTNGSSMKFEHELNLHRR